MTVWPSFLRVRFFCSMACLLAWCLSLQAGDPGRDASNSVGQWQALYRALEQFRFQIIRQPAVTRVTGPVTDDGGIDYARAINEMASAGVRREKNAAVLLWSVLPEEAWSESAAGMRRQASFMKLGEIKTEPGVEFLDFVLYMNRRRSRYRDRTLQEWEDIVNGGDGRAWRKPWKAADYPLIAQWLSAIEPAMKKIEEATKLPQYYSPLNESLDRFAAFGGSDSGLIPSLEGERWFVDPLASYMHYAGGAFICRALNRIEQGDFEAAWHDISTARRLARLWIQLPTLFNWNIAMRAERDANDAVLTLIRQPSVPDRVLAHILEEYSELEPLRRPVRHVDIGVRFTVLDIMQGLVRGRQNLAVTLLGEFSLRQMGLNGRLSKMMSPVVFWLVEWNLAMYQVNRWFDTIMVPMHIEDAVKRAKAFDDMDEYFAWFQLEYSSEPVVPGRSVAVRLLFVVLQMTQKTARLCMLTGGGIDCAARADSSWRYIYTHTALTRQAIALAVFQRAHGAYPQRLDQLSPRYLRKLPVDVYSGKVFQYQRKRGGYVLYAAGGNRSRNDDDDVEPPWKDARTIEIKP